VCPSPGLVSEIRSLQPGQVLYKGEVIIAMRVGSVDLEKTDEEPSEEVSMVISESEFLKVTNTWDIFSRNGQAIKDDYEWLTSGRKSQVIDSSNRTTGSNIFIEEGAKISCSVLNAENGPIYIGKNAEVMEGSMIRGPFALGEGATVKMGAKIYGPTTIGPYCKVGGEVNSSVMFGYSNKAHDGFMGHSVLGEWCNIGADTNTSNLKNNYEDVKLWSNTDQTFVETGQQFCGLIMGDHSKSGINVMFNTGTVVGICCNIFGSGYQRNYIPSFSQGGTAGLKPFLIGKAVDVARRVYERRGKVLDENDEAILRSAYEITTERIS
jgi:UDP-N-acetylglucosamine diphosphorylase/glucosamine-1-phosphate N-acetyltransferase